MSVIPKYLILRPFQLCANHSRKRTANLNNWSWETNFFTNTRSNSSSSSSTQSDSNCQLESESHQLNSDPISTAKSVILDQSLLHVSEFGWSDKAIIAGAKSCGYSGSASGLFPRGGTDLALYFYQSSNKRLFEKLQMEIADRVEDEQPAKSVQQFVKDAVEDRVRMTVVYQPSWPQAMGLMAHPNAAADALSNLGQLVDDIWYLAGDQSHDMNWYSKRAELAYIYKATELYMLQDNSEDLIETSKFLERRFEDIGMFASALSLTNDFTKGLFNGGLQSLWTVMKNMSGVRPR